MVGLVWPAFQDFRKRLSVAFLTPSTNDLTAKLTVSSFMLPLSIQVDILWNLNDEISLFNACLYSPNFSDVHTICSEIRARYHPNPTPDRWPLESLPLGSETGIQVTAVVGIGDHLGRQLPVSLLVPVSVASVDTTLLPTKFWRRNRVEPEVGALVSILKFGNPQASVIGIGGRLEGSGSLSPSERWFHYS